MSIFRKYHCLLSDSDYDQVANFLPPLSGFLSRLQPGDNGLVRRNKWHDIGQSLGSREQQSANCDENSARWGLVEVICRPRYYTFTVVLLSSPCPTISELDPHFWIMLSLVAAADDETVHTPVAAG